MLESVKYLYWFLSPVFLTGFLLWNFLAGKNTLRESLFLIFILGVSAFYMLVLVQIPLGLLVIYFKITAALFPVCLAYFIYVKRSYFSTHSQFLFLSLLFSILALILAWPLIKIILYEPIIAWDARSIWYFRAKQLVYNNGFSKEIGLCSENCPTSFTHPAYPILMPAIAAFIAKSAGYWNEYVPKTNLLVLLSGVIFAMISLRHIHLLLRLTLFFGFMAINPYMHVNGYLDSWLGIYAGITLLFLCEYLRTSRKAYLQTFLCCLIFICYIKNEGTFLALCIGFTGFFFMCAGKNSRFLKQAAAILWNSKYYLLLTLVPYLLWTYHKKHLNLHEIDYDFSVLSEPDIWKNFFLSDKYFMMHDFIVQKSDYISLYFSSLMVICLSLLTYRLGRFKRAEFANSFLILCIPVVTALIFYLGICVVYYSSLIDLEWHLSTSADRLREHLIYMTLVSFMYAILCLRVKMKLVFD